MRKDDLGFDVVDIRNQVLDCKHMVYGKTGSGKSTFLHHLLPQDETVFLVTERRYGTLDGLRKSDALTWADAIHSFETKLQREAVKKQIKHVVIDGIDNLHFMCERFVEGAVNKGDRMGTANHGKDWNDGKIRFKEFLRGLEAEGYIVHFTAQATPKAVMIREDLASDYIKENYELISDKETGITGYEVQKSKINLPNRAYTEVLSMVDQTVFIDYDGDEEGEGERTLRVCRSAFWDGKEYIGADNMTVKSVPNNTKEQLPRDYEKIMNEQFEEVLGKPKHEQKSVKEEYEIEKNDFDELMDKAKECAVKFVEAERKDLLDMIVTKHFGQGNKMTDAERSQVDLVKIAVIDMEEKLKEIGV